MTKKEQRRAARDYAATCIADARSQFLMWVAYGYAHNQDDDPPELTNEQRRAATRVWAQAQAGELKAVLAES